jgi:hypothetical protein
MDGKDSDSEETHIRLNLSRRYQRRSIGGTATDALQIWTCVFRRLHIWPMSAVSNGYPSVRSQSVLPAWKGISDLKLQAKRSVEQLFSNQVTVGGWTSWCSTPGISRGFSRGNDTNMPWCSWITTQTLATCISCSHSQLRKPSTPSKV